MRMQSTACTGAIPGGVNLIPTLMTTFLSAQYSTDQVPSLEYDSGPTNQEIPRLVWKSKVHLSLP
jgi:hypothetical protein